MAESASSADAGLGEGDRKMDDGKAKGQKDASKRLMNGDTPTLRSALVNVKGWKNEKKKSMMERALNMYKEEGEKVEKLSFEGVTPEIGGRAKWLERQREREVKNKRLSKQKDGSYFSYMFLEKIFRESRKCKLCGAKDSGKPLTDDETSLELYVSEKGICGRQRLICSECHGIVPVISCETLAELPDKPEFRIDGTTVRDYCKRITHFEILHDLMELLHIAALDHDKHRKQRHLELAEFVLYNAHKVCQEWCDPENSELRAKKFLRLREETLLIHHKPVFTADHNEEYKEMYHMMAGSFRQHREKVKLLLELLKTTLFDNPTPSSVMLWISIAMIHAEQYQQFKELYDAKTFMQMDSTEYQALKDRYFAMQCALGIKKVPIVFVLFELPRFYHYVEFLKERVGKDRPTTFLTDDDRRTLEKFDRQAHKYVMRRKMKSGKLVSMETHLDMMMQQEEIDRELMFKNTREKSKAKRERRRQKKMRREEKGKLCLPMAALGSDLTNEERLGGGRVTIDELDDDLDDFDPSCRLYPPFRMRVMGRVREKTSLEKDMVADMTLRKPYKSSFDLYLEEEDRQWGMLGHWSRKDVLLLEEDMMFERKVCIRFKKPEKSYRDTIPPTISLPHGPGRVPTQGEVQLLMDQLLSQEIDPVSFDGACDKFLKMKLPKMKKKGNSTKGREKGKEEEVKEKVREGREDRAAISGEGSAEEVTEAITCGGDVTEDNQETAATDGEEKKMAATAGEGEVKEKVTATDGVKEKMTATDGEGEVKEKVAATDGEGEVKEKVAATDGEGEVKEKVAATDGEGEVKKKVKVAATDGEGEVKEKVAATDGVKEKMTATDGEGEVKEVAATDGEGEVKEKVAATDGEGEVKKKVKVAATDGEGEVKEKVAATDEVKEKMTATDGEGEVKEKVAATDGEGEVKEKVAATDGEGEVKEKVEATDGEGEVKEKVAATDGEGEVKEKVAATDGEGEVKEKVAATHGEGEVKEKVAATHGEEESVREEEEEEVATAKEDCRLGEETEERAATDQEGTAKPKEEENCEFVTDKVAEAETTTDKQFQERMLLPGKEKTQPECVSVGKNTSEDVTDNPNAEETKKTSISEESKASANTPVRETGKTAAKEEVNAQSVDDSGDSKAQLKAEFRRVLEKVIWDDPHEQQEEPDKVEYVGGPSKFLPEEKEMVENIVGVCNEYMQNTCMPRSGRFDGSERKTRPPPVISQISDNVMVAILAPNQDDHIPFSPGQPLPAAARRLAQQASNQGKNSSQNSDREKKPKKGETQAAASAQSKDSGSDNSKASKVESPVEKSTSDETLKYETDDLPVKGGEVRNDSPKEDPEEPKKEKKSKKKSKKFEKKAKQLVEAVQRRKAMEERYWQKRMLKRTPSEEAFDKLMENKDRTLAELSPEEKRVLMDHCHKRKREQSDFDRMMDSGYKSQGPEGMRSRLRQKLYDRRMDDYHPPSRSYSKRRDVEEEQPKHADPPKPRRKRRPRSEVKTEKASEDATSPTPSNEASTAVAPPESDKIAEVKEKLDKIGKDASMPETEPMKSKLPSTSEPDSSENPPETTETKSTTTKPEEQNPQLKQTSNETSNPSLHHKSLEMTKSSKVPRMTMAKQLGAPEKRVVSAGQFRSLLVDHLKANEQAESGQFQDSAPSIPKVRATISDQPHGKQPDLTVSLPAPTPSSATPPLKLTKKQRKEAKKLLRKQNMQLFVAQVDTQLLREQGFKVNDNSTTTTVICNKDGGIEQVLEGIETPEQISELLGGRYNMVSKGTGYLSVPGADDDGNDDEEDEEEENVPSFDAVKPKLETSASSVWEVENEEESGDQQLSGFPLTSKWRKDKRDKFKKVLMKGLGKAIPIEQPPEMRKMSPPKDELLELDEIGVEEREAMLAEEKEAEKKERKRRRKNEKKKADKQKKDSDEKQTEEETPEQENGTKHEEQATTPNSTDDGTAVPHKRQKPEDPPINPEVYEQPLERLGLAPLMLTKAPCYITLQDMEDVEVYTDNENSSPGAFVYRVSIANGGKDHPFREIFKFAQTRRHDLDMMVEVSEITCSRNHEDVLCLAGKPGRISYSCKIHVKELHAPYGKEPMSATLPVKPGYPSSSTLESLFSEGPVSFAKLAAEASRRPNKKPHMFDFGVSSDDSDLYMTKESRKRLSSFLQSNPDEVRRMMESEFAKCREKAAKRSERRKRPKPKKIAEKIAEMKTAKTKEGTVNQVKSEATLSKETSVSAECSTEPQPSAATKSSEDATATANGVASTDTKSKNRKTARDKFRRCEKCDQEILERIQLCAGCKKVAYCNIHCQKTHWKQHKKTCSYAQKSSEKVRYCENCATELTERVLVCAGCKTAAYCDSTCQRSHWKDHKKTCSYILKKAKDTKS